MEIQPEFPRHDEIHIISDLHMGGDKPDFQILRETRRLAGFIRWVSAQRPEDQVVLVLNGDVIDTLAEEVGGYVATSNAVSTLERIMNDCSFEQVWSALADFVKKPNRRLVIVIGNHDIELALQAVQHSIVTRISGEDVTARGQIEFSTVGAGYTCMVGNARIFCIHGNEVDPWNFVRYEDLSKLARRLNAGRTLEPSEWEPNAGTRMVKDVMNNVKRRYAWIDLLKPETQAAVGVLLVLDPSQVGKISRLPGIVGELAKGGLEFHGRLGGETLTAAPAGTRTIPVDQLLGPNVAQGVKLGIASTQKPADLLAREMLLQAESKCANPAAQAGPAAAAAQPAMQDQTLGLPRLVFDRLTGWISGVGKDEALRRALQDWLADDKTFDHRVTDYTFKNVTKAVGSGIDFIVTGHTHLHKAIDMGGRRYYFNTGTWIRLLRFTPAMLQDNASFNPVFKVLEDGCMSTIDEADFAGESFVLDRTSTVRIKADSSGTTGSLATVTGADTIEWNEVESFPRV